MRTTSGFSNPMSAVGDLIIGGASGGATRLAAGTDGYVLQLVSGSPAWTARDYYIGGTDVAISDGGTGLSSISAKSIWVANSANVLTEVTPAAGQSIRINAGATAWEAYTPVASGGLTVEEVTGTTKQAVVNYKYIANNASQVVFTLPDTAALGDEVMIIGKGAGGWRMSQNASENIRIGNTVTTTGTGGYITSDDYGDCCLLECIVANTTWRVVWQSGSGLIFV